MLMVIFGAGASYDSAQCYRLGHRTAAVNGVSRAVVDDCGPWRPPLAKDLFRDADHAFGHIVARYPKLNHILTYLREPSGGSVEEQLESLQDQSNGHPETQRELASVRFYLRDLLYEVTNEWIARTHGITNYGPLLREILRLNTGDAVCLVTFNYDLLLDRSLYTFEYSPREPEQQFNSHSILKLFKPHGSVDWARTVVGVDTGYEPQHVIRQAHNIKITNEFRRVGPNDISSRGKAIVPAIAIPVQTKTEDTFEWPQSHRTYFEQLLPSVTKILIIGWQAKEAQFVQMLRANLRSLNRLIVVGANASDAEGTLTACGASRKFCFVT